MGSLKHEIDPVRTRTASDALVDLVAISDLSRKSGLSILHYGPTTIVRKPVSTAVIRGAAMVSMRDRQRSELLQTIADRDEVIARALAERDEAIRQCGLLDALDLLESAAFRGGPVNGEIGRGKLDEVASLAKSEPHSRPTRTTSDGESEPEYRPSLIDGEIFEQFAHDLNPRYRRAVLRMIEMLEREHPKEVLARTIDESIEAMELCPSPTFSKLKGALKKASLVAYNSSRKTYFIPGAESNHLGRSHKEALNSFPAGG